MNSSGHKNAASNRTARFLFALILALALLPSVGNAAATKGPANVAAKNNPKKAAATNSPAPAVSFEAFRIIEQRNIFNPNRYARGQGGPRNPRQIARAPGFVLVGTMIYGKGAFAFFDGTDSQYKKVLKPSDTIADYRVAEIAPSYVKLETSGNQTTLPVGMQMKEIDGKWELAEATESLGKTSDNPSGVSAFETTTEAGPETSSGGGNGADAILKRLMQQREKELQK
jgi:hypothetical protein